MKRMNVKIDNNSNTSQKGKVCQHTFNKTEKGTTGYFFFYEIQPTAVLWY